MKVLTIIVTYNGEKWIQDVVDCLSSSTIKTDVFIIDNNSTNSDYLNNLHDLVFKITYNDSNLGFGRANNIGLKYALENNYDYVFLLNQDCYVQSNTIEKLVRLHGMNKNFGILSPIHLNGEGTKLDFKFSMYLSKFLNLDILSDFFLNRSKTLIRTNFVNAAAWLISKKCLEVVGGFDPMFFHYGEDENYCQRLIFHGFKIGVVIDCFVFHDRNQSYKRKDKYFDYDLYDRVIKVELGDLNINFINAYRNEKNIIIKKILISFIFLRFMKAINLIKLLFLLKLKKKPILFSRKINESPGFNYLNE